MASIQIPTPEVHVNSDPYYEAACKNVEAAFRDLVERGIVDAQGNRIRQDCLQICKKAPVETSALDAARMIVVGLLNSPGLLLVIRSVSSMADAQ